MRHTLSSGSAVVGGFDYFAAHDGIIGSELWRTDGTTPGTALIKDLNPGASGSNPQSLTNVNGKLFFSADDGTGNQLWVSDGTAAATISLFDAANPVLDPQELTSVGSALYFTARDNTFSGGIWKTDGTIAGTVLVKNIGSFQYPRDLTNVGGTLYFTVNDGATGTELWKTNGTSAGTVQAKDIVAGPAGSYPSFLTNLNGTLFFEASDPTGPFQLFKSNGTAAGTTPIVGALPGRAVGLVNVGGTLFFSAFDGATGYELWRSDGTKAGTVLVIDVLPGAASSFSNNLGFVNGRLIFAADDGVHGREMMTLVDINAAPSFAEGGDQNVTDESGAQSIAGWAMGISVGPADEASQTAVFSVQANTNTALFATQPTIDPTGKLTFTPKPNVSGSAQITIVLKDNGGTANGGNDVSAPQTFTINVTKPRPWHNTVKPLDVNNDSHVVAGDALLVINYVNAFGSGLVPANAAIGQPFGFLDADGDNHVSPVDALTIINTVNAGLGGEGESSQGTGDRGQGTMADLLELLAQDAAGQTQGRRRGVNER